jgi:hypothetical protein
MLLYTLFLALTTTLSHARIDGTNDYGGSARRVNIADSEVLMMYQKWVDTGLSSLMAAVANKRWAWFFGRRLILFFQNFKVFAQ